MALATSLRALSLAPVFSIGRINHKEGCKSKPAEVIREGWAACESGSLTAWELLLRRRITGAVP
jgi:hypothetical protein